MGIMDASEEMEEADGRSVCECWLRERKCNLL